METKCYQLDENKIEKDKILEAGQIILNGGLVAFPTETVYGLGGDALNAQSAKKIYAAKGRPSDNPLIIHIAEFDSIKQLIDTNCDSLKIELAEKLANAFWPGPLTIILPKGDGVPLETTGGLDTVAIRMPDHRLALEFIKAAGGFVAAPSANLSGKPSPTQAMYVKEDMNGRIEMILDAGEACIGLESTIVDITSDIPCILRPGYITIEMLQEVIGPVEIDGTILSVVDNVVPKAPGMKYRHYAPKADMTIVSGDATDVVDYVNKMVVQLHIEGKKVGVIATEETKDKYHCDSLKNIGNQSNKEQIGSNLYRVLREFDGEDIDIIYSQEFDLGGMGQAIMNRLLKAAGHSVINITKGNEKKGV